MGTITKIHESVFPLPTFEDRAKRQIADMGERYICAPKARPMPELTSDAFLMRQNRRQREAVRGKGCKMNRTTLASAERTAHALAWSMHEQQIQDADAIEQMECNRYEEIIKSAEEMESAMIWLGAQSHDNASLIDNAYHALDKAARGRSNEAILEAAIGIANLRDQCASEYARHLVSKEMNSINYFL